MLTLVVILIGLAMLMAIWTNSRKTAYWARRTAWNSYLSSLPPHERARAITWARRKDWLMIPVRLVIAIVVIVSLASFFHKASTDKPFTDRIEQP